MAIVVCVCVTLVSAQRDDEVLRRAGAFVLDASSQLSGVIADEAY
jgi:hypothetical protein